MRIVIVGAGEVGSYLASRLEREDHKVTVVEIDPKRAQQIENLLDVMVVAGSGSHPETMKRAKLHKSDLLVAVTSDDETNLVACKLAKRMGVPKTIVRIEARLLRDAEELLEAMEVDVAIDPDEETAEKIYNLLSYPGATELNVLADGEVIVVGTVLDKNSELINKTLSESDSKYGPDWSFLIGSISRNGETIIPRRDMTLREDDMIRIVSLREISPDLQRIIGLGKREILKVMLLGGGRTAEMLARRLAERRLEIALVERKPERARELAEALSNVLILQGDITDAELLKTEGIADVDAVVALTGNDEDNMLACLFAKSQGDSDAIALLHRLEFLPLLRRLRIDGALSPRTACANGVLREIRGGMQVTTFLDTDIEVLEITLKSGSKPEGRTIGELHLPKNVLIAAVVRSGGSEIGRARTRLQADDHLVLLSRPEAVSAVRKRFE